MMDNVQKPQGNPIPFIINENDEFKVTEGAIKFLEKLKGKKIGVVCVVGKYRTGKSYLINKVILDRGQGKGFTVGPTVNPCTKGLWIWDQTIKSESQDHEDMELIVMDLMC